jgi:hypothetical protein
MKITNEVLQVISNEIDISKFYSIRLGEGIIHLQGYFDSNFMDEIRKKYLNSDSGFNVTDSNFVECKFSLILNDYTVYVQIILT